MEDVGEANAMIFEAHQLMLEDPDYVESIENIIRTQDVNAEYAIGATADNFAAIFEAMDDAYMQGRAARCHGRCLRAAPSGIIQSE